MHGVFPSEPTVLRIFTEEFNFAGVNVGDSGEVVTPFMRVGTHPTRNCATLGSVIVTAAVYRGFRSMLAHITLHLPAPGRRQTLILRLKDFAEPCVFSEAVATPKFVPLQIWLPKFKALLSRSYESNLPSSSNIVLSNALVCSTHPPVAVWGTVYLLELYPGTPQMHLQSDKKIQSLVFVTSSRPRNSNLVPIDYGFRHTP